MSTPDRLINFIACGSLDKGSVSKADRVIRGVSMITGGVMAKGHDLHVDDTTLHQLQMCASSMGQVPVKVNHKTGAEAVCGYLTGFRRDGNKLRADWHLLETHPQTNQILETAEKMPGCVGLSVSFVSPPKQTIEGGMKKARCQELVSTDYVVTPAANPDGLFARGGVDNSADSKPTAMTPEQLKEILDASLKPITDRLAAVEAQNTQLAEALQNGGEQEGDLPQTPEEIAAFEAESGMEATNEYLASIGLTRAEVNQAHADAQAALAEGDQGGEGDGDPAGDQGGEGAPALAGAAAGGESAALSRLMGMVTNLERKFAAQANQEAQVQFQSEAAELTEFVQGLQAENEALREQLGYAQSPASQITFSGFNPLTTDLSEATYEGQVELKAIEFAAANPSWSARKVQVEALNFVRRNMPKLHTEFRSRFGKVTRV